ncbi:MAG: pyruvate dehydrogenase (acetyl-transferring), homodimeric type, partial [Lentisphaeria bacterium]|nr:pyruvate dehydrogenase (acetyl-transferring), homodimeric type [Lentisphaeria bacterium]NQZ68335.1 pyruvate dehydrogenase (acetyl-transferring), homodimeric type [Lentisphaeria bacterium]
EDVLHAPFYRPNEDSQEMQYLHARRKALGGYLPVRVGQREAITMPDKKAYDRLNEGTNPNNKAIGVGNTASTTMSYVSLLGNLLKDKNMGHLIVPIVPDEARTFGMEGLFRQVGIYASDGQKYVPVDKVSIAAQFYKESKDGQILQEGINEDGSLASFIAAGTAYSTHGVNTIPFYVYYSMFGFQRVGDFCWAAGDARTKGFLFGATAGRTTLNGEGLQHQDGHSHLLSSTVPNCISYDPAYAYELGILVEAGIKRMYVDMDDVFYYITLHNDKYEHLPMPADKDIKEKVVRGIYKLKASKTKNKAKAQLFGSAVTVPIAIKAAEILEKDYKVSADVWSVTSYTELRREALDCDRQNLLHPDKKPHVPYISYIMEKEKGVVVAASDYMKILPEGIRKWIPQAYTVLGTDGYGRSEIREVLRDHFEINEQFIVLATLTTLVDEGALDKKILSKAIKKLGIDPDKINPQYA